MIWYLEWINNTLLTLPKNIEFPFIFSRAKIKIKKNTQTNQKNKGNKSKKNLLLCCWTLGRKVEWGMGSEGIALPYISEWR
jgi:hypothetical protein